MSKTVTFDSAPLRGTINLGIGQPSADLLPVELLSSSSEAFFAQAEPLDLNYGVPRGDPRFLEQLAGFLTRQYGAPASPGELLLTGGNSHALSLVASTFTNPGDTVFVEEPSYFLAFDILRDLDVEIVGIELDGDGPELDALTAALELHRPALFYTIPSYHNPTGICASAERRNALVELAQQHGFLIVADEPYQLLHYYDPPPPAMGTMVDTGVVLSMGSFSKILAPGMRLGWLQGADALLEKVLENGVINSGGAVNHISSHLARHALASGRLDHHILTLRAAYRARLEAMDAALRTHLSGIAAWSRPDGGYFMWLRLGESVDTAALKPKALELQTGFTAGSLCSATRQLGNCLRLSFAHYREDQIQEGIARLRPLFDR